MKFILSSWYFQMEMVYYHLIHTSVSSGSICFSFQCFIDLFLISYLVFTPRISTMFCSSQSFLICRALLIFVCNAVVCEPPLVPAIRNCRVYFCNLDNSHVLSVQSGGEFLATFACYIITWQSLWCLRRALVQLQVSWRHRFECQSYWKATYDRWRHKPSMHVNCPITSSFNSLPFDHQAKNALRAIAWGGIGVIYELIAPMKTSSLFKKVAFGKFSSCSWKLMWTRV